MINKEYIKKHLGKFGLVYPDSPIPISSYSKSSQNLYKSLCMQILKQNFRGEIKTFIPGKQFASLSVTGSSCELNCEHCHSHYLSHMQDVSSEKKLRDTLDILIEKGAHGCLISGGCDSTGKVPLLRYYNILKEYKKISSLIFNFHVGLVNEEEIQKITEIQPDFVSFDFTMDEDVIKDVYHMKRNVADYLNTYQYLLKYRVRTVPHICVGLNFGNIQKEFLVLQEIANYPVDLIVFLVIISPPHHPKFHEANLDDIKDLFTSARLLFPHTELSLGCMRPRGEQRHQIEEIAVQSGFNRYEIPSRKTLSLLEKNNISIQTYNVCCAVSKMQLTTLSKP